ncbi:MAG: hypothetical protein GY711_03700 [bacterium]|nr:hypothetical protein [bacterium]
MTRVAKTLGASLALAFGGLPAFGQDLTNQDECSQAQLDVRTGDGSWDWDNDGATTGAEGQAEGNCYAFGLYEVQSDIWFVWEATVDGSVVISTCPSTGGNTDTKIAAYPGDCCPEDGDSLACNDDSCSLLSDISFSVACGESYMIQLGSFPGSGDGTATVEATQAGTPCGPTEWTQSLDNSTIADTTGIACPEADTQWWRLYDPVTQGVSGDFEITEVRFGLEAADAQTLTVRVRDGSGFPIIANMPVLDSVDIAIGAVVLADQAFFSVSVSTGTIAAGTPIALELSAPGGGARCFIGANSLGQTGPSYISTVTCGIPEPTDLAAVGFPDSHQILDCTASTAPPVDDSIGCNYCIAEVNSTGSAGVMSANGSVLLADNDVTLTASNLPPNENGYFLAGPGQGMISPGASLGNFCLAGGNPEHLGRYDGDVFDSGAAGMGSLTIDVDAVPIAGGIDPQGPFVRTLLPGETWNFQCWFRDGEPNNFTDAIAILFQ